MASKESVNDIVREMRAYAKNSKVNGGEVDVWNWLADYADRIEAAHKRALAAKDDERLTIVAMFENVIVDKDAEIAELRECLRLSSNSMEMVVQWLDKYQKWQECLKNGVARNRKALEGGAK